MSRIEIPWWPKTRRSSQGRGTGPGRAAIAAGSLLPLAALAAMLAGCSRGQDGPIAVDVIGGPLTLADPDRQAPTQAQAVLLGAVAQGLVRFDGAGQIEPGLGIRWDVSDDGLIYTFRIADRQPVDAEEAARAIRAAAAPAGRNALRPVLGAIEEAVAVTPQVIELHLRGPRPNLLQLLAQPDLALLRHGAGTGPFRIAARPGGASLLTPTGPDAEDIAPDALPGHRILLRAGRAGQAVARFEAGDTRLVLGGSFADLAVARAASLPREALRFDPAQGLFGLAFADVSGFAGSVEGRRALAIAIDRDRIVARFAAPGWKAAETIAPAGIADMPAPARPDWIDTNLAVRRALARAAANRWATRTHAPPAMRVALPVGPGARLLFALLRADWAAVGISATAVTEGAPAELRLIDAVAPADIASWYLRRFTCDRSAACSGEADAALEAARIAPTLAERSARLADADARLEEIVAFVPIATPMRWSLVAPRLPGYQDNARAIHPLNHLLAERR